MGCTVVATMAAGGGGVSSFCGVRVCAESHPAALKMKHCQSWCSDCLLAPEDLQSLGAELQTLLTAKIIPFF